MHGKTAAKSDGDEVGQPSDVGHLARGRIFGLGFLTILVVVGFVGSQFGLRIVPIASDGSIDGEPSTARRVTAKSELTSGVTGASDKWRAVRYETQGGLVCVDIEISGPSTTGKSAMAGGCFIDGADGSGQGLASFRDVPEFFAYGRLQGPVGGAGEARAVELSLPSGDRVQVMSSKEGLWAATVAAEPEAIAYISLDGERWAHPFRSERP